MSTKRKVYLIGAGPGDPALITVKGLQCLKQADVVVYDSLISPALLTQAPPSAKLIFVGKHAGKHAIPQEQISLLLVKEAQAGNIVARLKGGDPLLFGRGAEEAQVLANHAIPFEIIPGVTSALAAPAYAGIPATHRDFSSSVILATGHEAQNKQESALNWSALAKAANTHIFLMGVKTLRFITEKLIAHGLSPKTPTALVHWGTTPNQKTLTSTLENIAQEAEKAQFQAPAVVIVGEVVSLRDKLRWFDNRPLFGKKILVTRSKEQAPELSDRLRQAGAEPIEFPVIKIAPPESYEPLDAMLRDFSRFDWTIFTSTNAVQAVLARLRGLNLDVRALAGPNLCAIGPATAAALEEKCIRVDFIPQTYTKQGILDSLQRLDLKGKHIALPQSAQASKFLAESLEKLGAKVYPAPAYQVVAETAQTNSVAQALQTGEIHALTFTSPSTVKNLVDQIGKHALKTNKSAICCIGPVTAQAVRELDLEPKVIAKEHTIQGLVAAMEQWFAQHH